MTDGDNPARPSRRSLQAQAGQEPTRRPVPRQIDSRELLQEARELQILHGGEVYRLQVTSRGRLILVK
jgi:hemin uptake protein HemP